MTFWDHLDELRKTLTQPLIAVVVLSIGAFLLKDQIFGIVLAANSPDFVVYGLADSFASVEAADTGGGEYVKLISTELPAQFLMHMKISFIVGLLCALPFVFYKLFRFVSPALYERERKYSIYVIVFSFVAFYAGVAVNYFVIFPFSLRFLAGYQVSSQVENTITIGSYVSTLTTLSLLIGIFFELPVMAWILAKLGLLTAAVLKKYRRHAIVGILIIAAVITPTTDIFTLLLVSVPIIVLYELSIVITRITASEKKTSKLALEPNG